MTGSHITDRRHRVLVTGSRGLIGSALTSVLSNAGFEVATYDVCDHERQDVMNLAELTDHLAGCSGVVHLAAVSRVAKAEQDPERCRRINVDGLHNLLAAIDSAYPKPWLVFASSREVYGSSNALPVAEDAPLRPVNVYGHTKVTGEQLVDNAAKRGLRAAVIRLTNVYGSANDHDDRVVPAFIQAALSGKPLRVDGRGHTFDFTFVQDVALGILRVVELLERDVQLPVLQLASGEGKTLSQLAYRVLALTGSSSVVVEGRPRNFDVDCFVGDPQRATRLLGWKHATSLKVGLSHLIGEYRAKLQLVTVERSTS